MDSALPPRYNYLRGGGAAALRLLLARLEKDRHEVDDRTTPFETIRCHCSLVKDPFSFLHQMVPLSLFNFYIDFLSLCVCQTSPTFFYPIHFPERALLKLNLAAKADPVRRRSHARYRRTTRFARFYMAISLPFLFSRSLSFFPFFLFILR